MAEEDSFAARLAAARAMLPTPDGKRFVPLFRHGTLEVELYAPRGEDPQKPHTRDEVYVVMSGQGEFLNGSARERFEPGDVLFVPAFSEHRFENFTDDLVVWVLFYGPEGGEAALAGAP
jgi:mannose-6-phosphate isomerase-like protein (cupin superfamily)